MWITRLISAEIERLEEEGGRRRIEEDGKGRGRWKRERREDEEGRRRTEEEKERGEETRG